MTLPSTAQYVWALKQPWMNSPERKWTIWLTSPCMTWLDNILIGPTWGRIITDGSERRHVRHRPSYYWMCAGLEDTGETLQPFLRLDHALHAYWQLFYGAQTRKGTMCDSQVHNYYKLSSRWSTAMWLNYCRDHADQDVNKQKCYDLQWDYSMANGLQRHETFASLFDKTQMK